MYRFLNVNRFFRASLATALVSFSPQLSATPSDTPSRPKPASASTQTANQNVLADLPFSDRRDFADIQRGFIAPLPNNGVVLNAEGETVWDLNRYNFLLPSADENTPAPSTVNPSLWRQSQLVAASGLFKVTERIYQVRAIDLSNITFIEGEQGLIILDPLISSETAKAALDLYYAHRPQRPIVAVIYSHSHIDHFGGVKGVISEADVKSGKVQVIAPSGFLEEAVSENVFAGNAMSRRATYMYGQFLTPSLQGVIGTGLGVTTSKGTTSLIAPTKLITKTREELVIDGLTFSFVMAPDTEAPAEMHFFIRELHALCPAENATHTLHNVYTLRGAKIRDPRAWAKALDETIDLYASSADVIFAPHHWPVWGNAEVTDYLKKQRDMYQYINDQTLRLANHGYKMTELAENFVVPDALAKEWSLRGYYGTVNHNVKSTYVHYLGWYDSNPATLHALPEVEASKRYVEFMGGPSSVLGKARSYFAKGDYRWVVQVVNHVIMAAPSNTEAKALQADALEQLGYQAESGPWRNEYLSAAQELRQGVKPSRASASFNPDILANMSADLLFEYFAIRLNGPKAAGQTLTLGFDFTDTNQAVTATVENGVLHHKVGSSSGDVSLALTRKKLSDILISKSGLESSIADGSVQISGNVATLKTFLGLLDDFNPWFNIVTPRAAAAH